MGERFDAVIVGSGPNGLAAAIELARHDLSVLVIEGHDRIGGGTRTTELTLPGFHHDVCAAAHPFAVASPFLRDLPLSNYGLEWITPPAAFAHPLDGRPAAMLRGSVADTAAGLGIDRATYNKLLGPLMAHVDAVIDSSLSPLVRIPRSPFTTARFGLSALSSARLFSRRFASPKARALIAGLAAHSVLPLSFPATSGVGLALALAGHRNGWPIARGGSARLTDAMAGYLETLGGTIRTGQWVRRLEELPPARAVLLDVTPLQFATMAGARLSTRARRRSVRWRYGPASFKVDYALSEPIPWIDPQVSTTATVHVGGTFDEIATGERAVWEGRPAERPFVLLTQPTLHDPSRAPGGKHIAWAYCHVPANWDGDATDAITRQIERFAPGFADTILAAHTMGPAEFERYNPNNVGGAVTGGAATIGQLVGRPRFSPHPHATAIDDVYLCSAATAPGAGTHGMCGFHAARTALRKTFR
jgi:phytoene dehydrogenase-like protein